jgi:hypothetical protein
MVKRQQKYRKTSANSTHVIDVCYRAISGLKLPLSRLPDLTRTGSIIFSNCPFPSERNVSSSEGGNWISFGNLLSARP